MNREVSKQEALRVWNERHQQQLRFIAMVFDNRGYKHNIHDVEQFNSTIGKIVYSDGQSTTECYLTDNCLTFKDSDLVLSLGELALWLDS